MKIEEIREKINTTDKALVKLFEERMSLSKEMALFKMNNGIVVGNSAREQEIKASLASEVSGECAPFAFSLYDRIFELSRQYQHDLIKNNSAFGLVGKKLAHSYSPGIHRMLADYSYSLIELEDRELEDYFLKRPFVGVNVTIPYKKSVIPFLDELTETAKRTGSVNTVIKRENDTLIGENTDYSGFFALVKRHITSLSDKKCLVLGDGGSAATVRTVLADMGASDIVTVSRQGENNYSNLDKHADAQIIVNTTPVGMYPENGSAPVDVRAFPDCKFVFDLIYNPSRTKLLYDAEECGIPSVNGLYMLVSQAKRSAELFTGQLIDDSLTESAVKAIEWQTKNVILIGMPGCGKTTAGKALSVRLGRRFIDTDRIIEQKTGEKAAETIRKQGIKSFRSLEAEVLRDVSKESGLVIATGGGIVEDKENHYPLRQNSTVVYLERAIDKLATDDRPLSNGSESLSELAGKRIPLYGKLSDVKVNVSDDVNKTVEAIIKELQ